MLAPHHRFVLPAAVFHKAPFSGKADHALVPGDVCAWISRSPLAEQAVEEEPQRAVCIATDPHVQIGNVDTDGMPAIGGAVLQPPSI